MGQSRSIEGSNGYVRSEVTAHVRGDIVNDVLTGLVEIVNGRIYALSIVKALRVLNQHGYYAIEQESQVKTGYSNEAELAVRFSVLPIRNDRETDHIWSAEITLHSQNPHDIATYSRVR